MLDKRKPRKLTAKEAAWVRELESVLLRTPSTLCLATMGYSSMQVWCTKRYRELNALCETNLKASDAFSDNGPTDTGLCIGYVETNTNIHGISG